MRIIVVTGKSGSGKSTFCQGLKDSLNAKLLSLDAVSHLSLEDKKIMALLKKRFGEKIFTAGKIDRKKLGGLIFSNEADLEYVNGLSWKFMDDYIDTVISQNEAQFLILDYALLPVMKFFGQAEFRVLLFADHDIRFNRIKARDNITGDYFDTKEKRLPKFNEKDYDLVLDTTLLSIEQITDAAKNFAKKIQI